MDEFFPFPEQNNLEVHSGKNYLFSFTQGFLMLKFCMNKIQRVKIIGTLVVYWVYEKSKEA